MKAVQIAFTPELNRLFVAFDNGKIAVRSFGRNRLRDWEPLELPDESIFSATPER